MNSRFVVDPRGDIKIPESFVPAQPPLIVWLARFFSYLLHPVFIPVWVTYFMVYQHPLLFNGFSAFDKFRVFTMSVVMYCFFPVVTVLLLKALGFVKSIQLHHPKDRIIPLVACGIWYFWIWYVWRNLPDFPPEAIRFALAVWISASIALLLNTKMKISLHAIAAGIMAVFVFLLAITGSTNVNLYFILSVFLCGIAGTSRFIVSDHRPAEVYGGFLLGLACMLTAWLLI
ncbi:MAG: hypothetical protein N2747_05580 [Chitinophagaceae bacterium]|nr:hypothetical protein [Chitinophagaceae bacterium]